MAGVIAGMAKLHSENHAPATSFLIPILQTRNHARKGFTLIELLIVIVIIVALAGTLATTVGRIRARSRATNCAANLRQIGMACMMYAGDHQMTLPVTSHQRSKGGKSWTLTLQEYAGGTVTFKCADDVAKARSYTYVINDYLTPQPGGLADVNFSILARIGRPESTFMFAEASPSYQNSDHFHFADYHGAPIPPEVFRDEVEVEAHGQSANYLFADGHVETLTWADVQARLAADGSRFVDPSSPETSEDNL